MSDPVRRDAPTTSGELASPEAGPRRVVTLASRNAPLSSPQRQLATLAAARLGVAPHDFDASLAAHGWRPLRPVALDVFQVNLGKLCNMACAHCHVDAGPDRVRENMDGETVDLCLDAIDRSGARVVDLTGGAPELNPHFRRLVEACVDRGLHVMDRCNLTVLLLPRCRGLPEWLAERRVEVVCSLPHHRKLNTDAQRGDGTHARSLEAMRRLNAAGYGRGDEGRRLSLVSNPAGAFLAGSQPTLEREWKTALERDHGVTFDRLLCLNNMPIARFLDWLEQRGHLETYLERLVNAFNPATIPGLMCRNTISVSWDGRLYDCDFNQMLNLGVQLADDAEPAHVRDFDPERLARRRIVTGRHCYGCTAGAGSGCGGAIDT